MSQHLHVARNAGLKRRRENAGIEKQLVDQLRAEGLSNPEIVGRPIVLFRDSTFLILIDGIIEDLSTVPLRTLIAFSADIHAGGQDPAHMDRIETNRTLDCGNLTTKEFLALTKVLSAYIKAGREKKEALTAAVAAMVGPA